MSSDYEAAVEVRDSVHAVADQVESVVIMMSTLPTAREHLMGMMLAAILARPGVPVDFTEDEIEEVRRVADQVLANTRPDTKDQ